ncbi:MAG: sialidase family protein [Candidatus Woesearchaeota archaeon]
MKKIIVLLCILLILASCASKEKSEEGIMQQQGQNMPPLEGMQNQMPIQGNQQGMNQQQGIYLHNVLTATSTDGETWTVNEEPIAEHGSVPDVVQLHADLGDFSEETLLTYFVDATQSETHDAESIGMIYSTDNGETWSDRETITFENADEQTPVDPSIVQLDDGTLRMYYFDIAAMRNQDSEFKIYVADSTDGKTFTTQESVYTSSTTITDPDVVYFNEQWFLYFVNHAKAAFSIYTSDDGLTFEEVGSVQMQGIPGVVVVSDEVHLYGCGMNEFPKKISSDGITFGEQESGMTVNGCDPSPIQLNDGSYFMVWKGYAE